MAGGLDHLVIVAKDLNGLADFYRRLGFQVGARNRHDWGTLNNIVQFDGCFLELLTTEPGFKRPAEDAPLAAFATVICDYLARREGLAMMVLEGFDAAADHEAFQAAGIGVAERFGFTRAGKTPEGTPVEVSFSLAFARSAQITEAGFFVCQQHAPEFFWNPAFQVHDNGVTGVKRVVFVAREPAVHQSFFERYTGVAGDVLAPDGVGFALARSRVELLTPEAAAAAFGASALPVGLDDGAQFAAVEFESASMDQAQAAMAGHGVPVSQHDGRLVVSAGDGFGLTIGFSAPGA